MMRLNSNVLLSKANYLSIGQWLFLASILSISLVVLLLTLVGISSGIAFVEQTKSVANELPISNAGSDQRTVENNTVMLDASESRDRDGTIKSYYWNQTSGYKVDILNNNDITAAFTAPDVTNATEFQFKLTVTDDKNASSDDTVRVIVKNDTLQDSSNPVICSGVVPYGTSYEDRNAYFHNIVDNNF